MRYWLFKSEPSAFSVDDLARAPGRRSAWTGVRNYQARNFMRDQMKAGDRGLFCHSGCAVPGIAGVVEVCRAAAPDETQFDPESGYFDAKATRDAPRWFCVELRLLKQTRLVPLAELRAQRELAGMQLLKKGNRLSIMPVAAREFQFITQRLLGERA